MNSWEQNPYRENSHEYYSGYQPQNVPQYPIEYPQEQQHGYDWMQSSPRQMQMEKLQPVSVTVSDKSWLTALLLFIFLGGFGVHRFYAGKIGTGMLQFFTFGGFGIWLLVDYILLIQGEFTDSNGLLLDRKPIHGGNKNWVTAAFLCSFLGAFGAHRFYVGKNITAMLQLSSICGIFFFPILAAIIAPEGSLDTLLMTLWFFNLLASWGIGIWVFVDYILILCGEFRDTFGQRLSRQQ